MTIIDTKLGIEKYIEIVDEIVANFFDEDGDYAPHYGRIHTMAMFIDNCVKEADWLDSCDGDVDQLLLNDEFITEYTKAITEDKAAAMNFMNAYRDALDIVEYKKSSLGKTFELICKNLGKYIDDDTAKAMQASITDYLEKLKGRLEGLEIM